MSRVREVDDDRPIGASRVSRRHFLRLGAGAGVMQLAASAGIVSLATREALAADDVDLALAEVARARASLKTLTGPFTQERTIGLMATKIRSTGTLTLVRPERLRWELAAPDSVVYWVGPEGVAYQSAHGRGRMPVTQGKLAIALEDIRTLLGGDLARLKDRYDLRVVSRTDEGISFEATPRATPATPATAAPAAAKLDKILFSLDRDRVRPTRATLVEGPRDRTEIVFGALERDAVVDPARVRAPF
ncbi:outer membrane lipoprotein carrier protein LolA [Pendulispora albinea]|uniref:Outer membrane lipoprotein carrier protein LolA n=1 Tax=Pendulispora albinea TaxID=2741071 RepID=A0ABZ2LSF2_9BACT